MGTEDEISTVMGKLAIKIADVREKEIHDL